MKTTLIEVDAKGVMDLKSEGWILDEDVALKEKLKGLYVSDQQQRSRKVDVWFGHPDQEIREQTYPYITIDLLEVSEAIERVHRGDLWVGQQYRTKGIPWWWDFEDLKETDSGFLTEIPTPINLDYQISTWARNPRHDRQILAQLLTGGKVMLRAGWLETPLDYIRRMDFLGHAKRDVVDANQKRLFNNVFRVRVSSEIPFYPISYFPWGPVNSIHIEQRLYRLPNDWGSDVSPDEVTKVVLRREDAEEYTGPTSRPTEGVS